MSNEDLLDAMELLRKPGGASVTYAISYANWKVMGGHDLPGAELGGGFVWVDDNKAEYALEPK